MGCSAPVKTPQVCIWFAGEGWNRGDEDRASLNSIQLDNGRRLQNPQDPQNKGGIVCGVPQMNPVLTCAQTRLVLRQGALPAPGWGCTLILTGSVRELLSVLFAAKSHSLQEGVREPEEMGGHRHDQLGVPDRVRHLVRGGGS